MQTKKAEWKITVRILYVLMFIQQSYGNRNLDERLLLLQNFNFLFFDFLFQGCFYYIFRTDQLKIVLCKVFVLTSLSLSLSLLFFKSFIFNSWNWFLTLFGCFMYGNQFWGNFLCWIHWNLSETQSLFLCIFKSFSSFSCWIKGNLPFLSHEIWIMMQIPRKTCFGLRAKRNVV